MAARRSGARGRERLIRKIPSTRPEIRGHNTQLRVPTRARRRFPGVVSPIRMVRSARMSKLNPEPVRGLAGCVAGLFVASAATWLRYFLEQSPRIDTRSAGFIGASAVAGLGLVVAAVCALRAARDASSLSWRSLLGAACGMQLVAGCALALTSADIFTNIALGELRLAGLSPFAHVP